VTAQAGKPSNGHAEGYATASQLSSEVQRMEMNSRDGFEAVYRELAQAVDRDIRKDGRLSQFESHIAEVGSRVTNLGLGFNLRFDGLCAAVELVREGSSETNRMLRILLGERKP